MAINNGVYAADGSFRVTAVDGLTRTGIYAADGSLNVTHDTTYYGLYHPCGALRVTLISSGVYSKYAADGSLNVSSTPYVSGSQPITLVSGSLAGVFVPDTTPSAYRTTTQTMIAGRNANGGNGHLPQLSSEFSISIGFRSVTTAEGFLWNFYDYANTSGAQSLGGGSLQAMALYYSGGSPGVSSDQNRFTLTGTDQAGNHIAVATVPVNTYGSAYGYAAVETVPNNAGFAILVTVQYRSGNIELWTTYRGMKPRLLIQQACTWTGTSGPLPFGIGAAAVTLNTGGSIELEMPIVIPDRSLSISEIAQLADGISPEVLNAASAKASAMIAFCSLAIDGTTTASDRLDGTAPVDGNTITLNGTVFTFRTTPSLGTDIQIYADYVGNMSSNAGTGIFTTASAHGHPDGRRVCISRTTIIGGTDPSRGYYIINSTSTTFQLSLTLGGAAITIGTGSSGSTRVSAVPSIIDNLVTTLNALTPNTGGASNAIYSALGAYMLAITHRTTGGTSFTFDCNAASVRFPTNKRLALAWVYITDYTAFRAGLFGYPGLKRNRTVAWVTPTLGELMPNTQVTGSVRVNSWTNGMVNNSVAGVGYLALSGIYTGNAPNSGINLKTYNLSGGAMVQDFTNLTSVVLDTVNKTWTGKITHPRGKRWLSYEVGKVGSSQLGLKSEVRTGVGILLLAHGRSHMTDIFNTYASNDVTPNGFFSRFAGVGSVNGATSGSLTPDGCWHAMDALAAPGAGEAVFCNLVSNANSCVLGITTRAVGGSSFGSLTDASVWNAYVADGQTTQVDASLSPLAYGMIWCQSQEYPYYTLLTQLRTLLTTYFGASSKLAISTSLTGKTAADGTILLNNVRDDQINYKNDNAADPTIVDLGDYQYIDNTNPPSDGIHTTNLADQKTKAEIWAKGINKALGSDTYGAVGPVAISATRSGAVIEVTFNLNGATTLQVPNVADVGGFDVTLASSNFTATLAPTFVSANNITDTFSTASPHGLVADEPLLFAALSGLPTGITGGTIYYAKTPVGLTFQVATAPGGAAVNFTTNGTSVYVMSRKALLAKSSVVITAANKVTITLAADPSAPVAVHFDWGRPGRQATDPQVALDTLGRAGLTEDLVTAQGNILCDNYSMTYPNVGVLGRLARKTVTSLITAS